MLFDHCCPMFPVQLHYLRLPKDIHWGCCSNGRPSAAGQFYFILPHSTPLV